MIGEKVVSQQREVFCFNKAAVVSQQRQVETEARLLTGLFNKECLTVYMPSGFFSKLS